MRQSDHATGSAVAGAGIERSEARSVCGRFGRKARLKDLVRPVAQPRHRPEVQRERHDTPHCRIAEALPHDVVDVDVGAAEAVDRLFRVADDEQRAGTQRDLAPVRGSFLCRRGGCRDILGQPEHDFRLHRVGVLKFINQEVPELLLQCPPHRLVFTQHARGQIEQVPVIQRVETAALSRGRLARPGQQRHR